MTPFIPGQFGQCARYGRFITHFLPVRLSDSGEKTEGPRGRKEGIGGGEREERRCGIDGGLQWGRGRKSVMEVRNKG